jgi:hypothetical protein
MKITKRQLRRIIKEEVGHKMKITKRQLRRIIKEERRNILREQSRRAQKVQQLNQRLDDEGIGRAGVDKVDWKDAAPQAQPGRSSGDGGAAERAISAAGLRLRPGDADETADAQAEGFQALGTVGSDYLMGYGILVMTDGSNYYLTYRESDWQDWGPLSLQKMVDELLYEEEEGNLD